MEPEIIDKRPVGRPTEGAEARTVDCKFRLEPSLNEELTIKCKTLGITKAQAIRRGIRLFIREANKHIY